MFKKIRAVENRHVKGLPFVGLDNFFVIQWLPIRSIERKEKTFEKLGTLGRWDNPKSPQMIQIVYGRFFEEDSTPQTSEISSTNFFFPEGIFELNSLWKNLFPSFCGSLCNPVFISFQN